jgi:hypothetical protein
MNGAAIRDPGTKADPRPTTSSGRSSRHAQGTDIFCYVPRSLSDAIHPRDGPQSSIFTTLARAVHPVGRLDFGTGRSSWAAATSLTEHPRRRGALTRSPGHARRARSRSVARVTVEGHSMTADVH